MRATKTHLIAPLAGALMLLCVVLAHALEVRAGLTRKPRLAEVIPASFGDWKQIQGAVLPVDPAGGRGEQARATDSPYVDVLTRAYGNSRGDVVLLAVAYGATQRQEI